MPKSRYCVDLLPNQRVYNVFATYLQRVCNVFTTCLQRVYNVFITCLQRVCNVFVRSGAKNELFINDRSGNLQHEQLKAVRENQCPKHLISCDL